MKLSTRAAPNTLLRQQRQRRHWTQTELARQLGTTYLSVCRWEQGTTTPSLHFRKQLCDLFELPPEELGLVPPSLGATVNITNSSPIPCEEALPQRRIPFFLSNRCHPPHLRADLLSRPGLLERLYAAVTSNSFVLLSAPAGAGKTTLLSALPTVYPELPVAWLALDEDDNDPICLLRAFVAALQRLHTSCTSMTLELLTDLPHPGTEVRRVTKAFLQEIEETLPQPFALVLDDLHVLTHPAAQQVLNALLEYLPPKMHLVVATRYDPPLNVARLRAHRQVREMRLEDLLFTRQEVQQFLTAIGLALSPAQVDLVYEHTQGWAAGLGLLASSLEHATQQSQGANLLHNLARTEQHVYDFLANEILNQQDATMSRFLLETSLLTELTPKLCQAVTGLQEARVLLEELYRRNLTVAVEPGHPVYRYHDLLRAFLQQHLAYERPQGLVDLHRRAAEAERLPTRSIRHYLEARLWKEAAGQIEQVGDQLLQDGLLRTVQDWINTLPPSLLQQRPRLLYLLGLCAWQQGNITSIKKIVKQAVTGFAATGNTAGQGEGLIILANACLYEHDIIQGHKYLEEALRYPIAPSSRILVLTTKTWQGFWRHDWEQAARDADEALNLGLTRPTMAIWNVLGLEFRMFLAGLPAGIARIERFCQNSVIGRFAEKNSQLKASLLSLQSFTLLIRGRLLEATQTHKRVLEFLTVMEGTICLPLEICVTTLHLSLACNDLAGLDRYAEEILEPFRFTPFFQTYAFAISYLEGRALWQQGRIQELRQVYTAFPFSNELTDAHYLGFLLQALLEIADHRFYQAEATLYAALELEPKAVVTPSVAAVSPILAYLYAVWGKPHKALATFGPLLAQCQKENMPGLILREGVIMRPLLELALEKRCHPDYTSFLLDIGGWKATPSEDADGSHALISRREIEVLQLLAEGLSNREIAANLIISELTVKSHVTHLLQKLAVPSRAGAVSRAHQLGLLQ